MNIQSFTKKFLENKWQQEAETNLRLWEQARQEAEAIIAMIINKYSPKRIYQWGSILNKDEFCEISDIDIGVEGIGNPERFFALYGDALEMTTFPIDIVEIDKIENEFADIIRLKGKLIYECE